jgi:hypothetical protein
MARAVELKVIFVDVGNVGHWLLPQRYFQPQRHNYQANESCPNNPKSIVVSCSHLWPHSWLQHLPPDPFFDEYGCVAGASQGKVILGFSIVGIELKP